MSEPAPKAELLRRLGQLVRGLSALFWGLPLTLLVYFLTARTDLFDALGLFAILPPVLVSGLLLFGLAQIGQFQKQERIWSNTLERARLFGVVNLGLSPFLYWWHRLPFVQLYNVAVLLLAVSSLLFLFILNRVLDRLAAMLPDETLRLETKLFTTFNRRVLLAIPILFLVYFALTFVSPTPEFLQIILERTETQGLWFAIFLILMPLAMTMALIWKIKEVVFASILETDR
ncbi:MAG: hypothetical protein ABIR24_00040 [Verrucomicrobiota bacterium]